MKKKKAISTPPHEDVHVPDRHYHHEQPSLDDHSLETSENDNSNKLLSSLETARRIQDDDE